MSRDAHFWRYCPFLLLTFFTLAGCRPNFGRFDPMVGMEGDTVCMDMDLTNAPVEGIVLPSGGDCFHFAFDTLDSRPLYYKIYYQNESYKFDEDDSLCHENFYGSWEDVSVGFKPVPADGAIRDSFRIVGNPRDERIYYGIDIADYIVDSAAVEAVVQNIRNNPEWYHDVCEVKAPANGNTPEEQLYLDARWVLAAGKHESGEVNHRWKRNPRTGCYSFLLVVTDDKGLREIPDEVQHIGVAPDGRFVNPYGWYFSHPQGHISLLRGTKVLRARAVMTPRQGVYLDELSIRKSYLRKEEVPGSVGSDTALYRHALCQQFFPAISKQYTLRNIPEVAHLGSYTQADYDAASQRYLPDELLDDYPQISSVPGSTVRLSPNRDYVSLINPGNNGLDRPRKESTGIKGRVGFSYGRYRGKIKFPPMLNKERVWNGLTYAFWLIYQDDADWNQRRPSYHGGYIGKNDESEHPEYRRRDYYSEIDIEIVKTSRFWPEDYYSKRQRKKKVEDGRANSDVMFCCTNWDLACPEPKKFASGITKIPYRDAAYEAMRWYDTYKALTTKTPIPNSLFDADVYYFEIEWKPKEIIWRLGPDPDHLQVVGYMNDRYTAIPNNQMLWVVTQEYHYSEWWPPIVYQQGLIPFSADDIEGRVYEIVVY